MNNNDLRKDLGKGLQDKPTLTTFDQDGNSKVERFRLVWLNTKTGVVNLGSWLTNDKFKQPDKDGCKTLKEVFILGNKARNEKHPTIIHSIEIKNDRTN